MSDSKEAILNNVIIAAPCTARWQDMKGSDRVRTCADCNKSVFNLSSMTKKEAEAFLMENSASNCLTFYRRADGTIMTDNCPVGLRAIRDKFRRVGKVAASIVAFFISLPAIAQDSPPPTLGVPMPPPQEDGKKKEDKPGSNLSNLPSKADKSTYEKYAQAQDLEEQGKFLLAETLYKTAICEAKSVKHDPALRKSIFNSYVKMLRNLHRDTEADKLTKEFNAEQKVTKQATATAKTNGKPKKSE